MNRLFDPVPVGALSEPDSEQPAPMLEELRREFPGIERSILSIETIFVSDKTVSVLGSVPQAFVLTADLFINGHYVPIGSNGRFCAIARLQGNAELNIWLETGIHGTVRLDVPLRAS